MDPSRPPLLNLLCSLAPPPPRSSNPDREEVRAAARLLLELATARASAPSIESLSPLRPQPCLSVTDKAVQASAAARLLTADTKEIVYDGPFRRPTPMVPTCFLKPSARSQENRPPALSAAPGVNGADDPSLTSPPTRSAAQHLQLSHRSSCPDERTSS